jgi:hypothetical protein
MGHLVFLIIQIFFIGFYILCKTFDWPGISVTLLFGWTFTFGFYIVMTFVSLFKRQYWLTLVYFVFVLLIISIPTKIWFTYYNIIVHFVLLSCFLLLIYKRTELELNKYFKTFILLIVTINIFLLFAGDNFVNEKLGANYLFKSYSSEQLNWDHFNKVNHIKGGYHAEIESSISCRINKVFNYTPATAVAKTELESNHFISKSDNLLEHELYHFKITEVVTRKLNKALDNYHFSNAEKTKKVFWQYLDTLNNMQKAYDTETEHNLNSQKQRQWKVWVDGELNK